MRVAQTFVSLFFIHNVCAFPSLAISWLFFTKYTARAGCNIRVL